MQTKRNPVRALPTSSSTPSDTKVIALGENIFPPPLEQLILSYIDKDYGESEDKKSDFKASSHYTLFSQSVRFLKANCAATQAAALEASQNILLGNLVKLKETIDQNYFVLHARIPEVYHPYPICEIDKKNMDKKNDKKILLFKNKTLLQIAAAIGSFNYTTHPKGPQGAVELIASYLTPAQIAEQLHEQFPEDWKKTTEDRAKLYMQILKVFAKTVINADDGEIHKHDLQQATNDCAAAIKIFWNALEALATAESNKTGFLLPIFIFNQAIDFYVMRNLDFGLHTKRNLFWVIGFGGFQRLCLGDHPVLTTGLNQFFGKGEYTLGKGQNDLSNLGIDYFIDLSSIHTTNTGNSHDYALWQKYICNLYNTKISALEKLLGRKNNLSCKLQ